MKEFLLKIKEKIKSLIPFRKLDPHVYWNNLLYIFSIIVVFLIIFSFYILYQIKNQQIFQIAPVSTDTHSLINEKLLNIVNSSFDAKKAKEKEIQDGLDSYKDPSIN